VRDIPPLGFITCRIEVSPADFSPGTSLPHAGGTGGGGLLENIYYRIGTDPATGRITGIYDKEWNRELTDPAAQYSPGEFIYERLGKNRGQLEQRRLDEFTRKSWDNLRFNDVEEGPIFKSIRLTGTVPGCAAEPGIRCEIRLYNHEKKIEFCYSMTKLPVTDPEGVYVAFPFKLAGGLHVAEIAGGTMVAGMEQIPGSASDWTGIQDFTALRSDSGQIVFVSPEIPMVQLGDINLGKFRRVGTSTPDPSPKGEGRYPASGYIYSWVLNNYWTTNFLASQEGELKWSYQVSSSADPSNALATRFGMENRVPFLSRVFPASVRPDTLLAPRSFYNSQENNVVLVSARPASGGKGIVLQLRETAGRADSVAVENLVLSSSTLAMATGTRSVSEVNVLGEPVKPVWERNQASPAGYHPSYIRFRPLETKFVLVKL
jgi:alpha-mannosidase